MSRDQSLPVEIDFDPWGGDLDAQCAWEHFGGLTLDQAKSLFKKNPQRYQEDFMFMGGKAFRYYFPVIDEHLRSIAEDDADEDHQAWILAHCIKNQFDNKYVFHVAALSESILDLAKYVRENINRFGANDKERKRVMEAWAELVSRIHRVMAL